LIVTDASIMLAFIMHDESEAYADAAVESISRQGGAVPGNFHSEVTHGLLQAERRGRIDPALSVAALREILALPLTLEMPDAQQALELARRHRLTCYDSFYLALAVKLARPLATIDSNLASVARSKRLHWTPNL
jgi:predicted nucleic acid-binding protein